MQGTEHVAGRTNAQIPFPNDLWISDRHANFIYRGEKLVVRDEGSVNGVYVRVRQPITISPGDQFLCGEQVFRLEGTPKDTSGPDPDQTYFYSSPKRPSPFRLNQILRGGAEGMEQAEAVGDINEVAPVGPDIGLAAGEHLTGNDRRGGEHDGRRDD